MWFDEMHDGWTWEPHELEVLRMAAEAYDRYQQAKREIDRDGATVLDRFNQRKPHPAHIVERDSRSAFLMALRQLRFEESTVPAGNLLCRCGDAAMPKREPQLEARLPPMERFWIMSALSFGPWRLTGPDNEPVGERRYSDAELERHWHGWAKFGKAPSGRRDWSERDWAVRRFELHEDAVAAFIECRRLQDERMYYEEV